MAPTRIRVNVKCVRNKAPRLIDNTHIYLFDKRVISEHNLITHLSRFCRGDKYPPFRFSSHDHSTVTLIEVMPMGGVPKRC